MDSAKIAKVQGTDAPPPTERGTLEGTEEETAILSFNTVDESAERAIGGVRRKLDNSLSVEYTVNELITSARDPANLSMIFAGGLF